MRRLELLPVEHDYKIGHKCEHKSPNITEDTIFTIDGEPIGFYVKDMGVYNPKLIKLADIADAELRSNRVPKQVMNRTSGEQGLTDKVQQYSTILGSIAPRPHMKRPYASVSKVHSVKTAETFIKAMLLLCKESEQLMRHLVPSLYENQLRTIEENIPKKWRFGKLFTSSISNFNISAPFHRDAGNLEGCCNVIITKKQSATGGNLFVPDYDATMDSANNSMLVYPAWRNMHSVTPIVPTGINGYRNSLVFYPLKCFKGLD
jgi:hypothetical protein